MYEIRKNNQVIKGHEITTFERTICSKDGDIIVEAGTNGALASDFDTYAVLSILTGDERAVPDIMVCCQDGETVGTQYVFHGRDQLDVFIRTLLFAAEALVDQVTEKEERNA